MRSFLLRHQPGMRPKHWILAGIGGVLAIGLTGAATVFTGTPLLMAPFGASCVLLFSVPASPLSQPANVVGGHVVATLIGFALHALMPDVWWAAALAVGIAVGVMAALRLTHPPAGADPLVVFASSPDLTYLLFPVLIGSVMLVATATVFHRLTGTRYPLDEA
ncbi:HPP family protein [Yunchengibacter salinarum]|uniref:HPP family protein n=1 Tax=Yunchengibacter salinarum TaxID=3133399 RepID=UPI0035B6AB3C